ncbi:MAG TPA: hypothetical protein VKN99_00890 [Polyangia bacterium]|nr:hypothetical protein [Polyangia bacterium]
MPDASGRVPPGVDSGTPDGCQGVTARGQCRLVGQDETAVTCDLTTGTLHQTDCTALGMHCLLDVGRGATCSSFGMSDAGFPPPDAATGGTGGTGGSGGGDAGLPPRPDAAPGGSGGSGGTGGTGGARCPPGLNDYGYCWGDTAIWCDTSTGITYEWNCPLDGLHCGVLQCALGASCCPSPGQSQCQQVGSLGICGGFDGNTVRWCDSLGVVHEENCTLQNKVCLINACGSGAWCC